MNIESTRRNILLNNNINPTNNQRYQHCCLYNHYCIYFSIKTVFTKAINPLEILDDMDNHNGVSNFHLLLVLLFMSHNEYSSKDNISNTFANKVLKTYMISFQE